MLAIACLSSAFTLGERLNCTRQLPCVQAFHASVAWGSLSDCSSWQPPPRWIWLPSQTQAQTRTASSPTSLIQPSEAASESCLVAVSNGATLHDQPCVTAAVGVDFEAEPSSSSKPSRRCQQTGDLEHRPDPQEPCQPVLDRTLPPDRNGFQNNITAIKHRVACHRLQVACTFSASEPFRSQSARAYGKLI